jgi:peptide/nickel transport system permease protein
LIVVTLLIFCALFAPILTKYDPESTNLAGRLKPPGWSDKENDVHIFGTDELGRDLFSRVLYGSRISILVGFTSVFISGLVGVILGLLAGYLGNLFSNVIMRIVDIQMAFPFIVLAIAVIAVLGSSLVNVIVVLAITSWVTYCRLVWSLTLSIKEKEFVEAAKSIGCRNFRIITRHIFPNILSAVMVLATFQFASMIVAESSLSFLGLGIPPPTPTWGSIISGGRQYLSQAWWVSTFPGFALAITTIGVTFLGDWASENLYPIEI